MKRNLGNVTKKSASFFSFCLALAALWLGVASVADGQPSQSAQGIPLRGYLTAHDPSTIIRCKNRYYLFYTDTGIATKSSSDLVYWSPGPPVFTNPPNWTTNLVPGFAGIFWAPDILFFNNKYYLYYAVSTFGSQVSAVGLVTNPTLDPTDPAYQWTDQGPVINSTNGSPYNTIDPSFSWDNAGNLWMAFGSYWNGIYLTQLSTTNGLRIAANSPVYQLAYNSSIEASYLWRRGGYYYLFVNWGSCCSGVNSTYNIRVGRSTQITGPYLDQNGVNMVSGGGSLFLQGTGKFCGPGHVGILSTNGAQWFSHHYYDANAWAPQYAAYGAPEFDFVPLDWTPDDWPVFNYDWSAAYNFQGDARDLNGQYSGLLENGASVQTDPTYGQVLNLNGTNQYVWLPPGVANAETFIAVVKWNGGADWQRIFDFGFDTSRTVMLTPASGDGVLRCDINPGGSLQTIQWSHPLPTNAWTQVAVTLDGTQAILYVNGLPVVTNTSVTYIPLNVEAETNALGQSKFPADPHFNGQFAAFRAYGRALSPSEIIAPVPTLVQPAAGSTYQPDGTIVYAGSATDFASRPLGAANLTWNIYYAQDGHTNLVAGPITGVASGQFSVPATNTGGGNYLVSLTATDNFNRTSTFTTVLSPANPPAGWSSYYPLRANANDANGHYNGVLHGGASFVSDPQRGTVLNLSGTNQYVSFPPGLSQMQTFMAWVKWNGGAPWQRIFDFGNDTNHYTVLTPEAADNKLRFNISVNSIPGEQDLDAPFTFPANIWTHVAVVMNGNNVVLYTNGTPVATNLFANLVPANLAATNIYFGKSQWPDPYFSGEMSSVRIFSSALTTAQIQGPQVAIVSPAQGGVYQPGNTISFSGSANDFNDNPISAANLTWAVNYINGGQTNIVLGPISGSASGTFAIPTTGNTATNGFYQFVLVATDANGRSATNSTSIFPEPMTAAAAWTSRYPFTNGFQDVTGPYNATPVNGPTIASDAVRGKALNLTAIADQYLALPAGAATAETISGWVKWSGGNSWQRIFDFGDSTQQFFYLTPSDNNNLPQVAITPDLAVYNQTLESPTAMPVNQWTHVAVAMNGREGILYLNGQAVAVNNSVNLLPSDIAATNCYLGKSQYPADPYFLGRLSDVRLNSSALAAAQIIGPSATITEPILGTLFSGGEALNFAGTGSDYGDNALAPGAFTWSVQFYSNGVPSTVGGPWTGITSGTFNIPTNGPVTTNQSYAIQLTVTDTNGYQQTATVTLPPQISQVTLDTVPSGLQLSLAGSAFATPSNLSLVAGYSQPVAAPATQNPGGTNYSFVFWSDGGSLAHSFSVPATNGSLIASYVLPTLENSLAGQKLNLSWPAWAAPMNLYSTTNLSPPINWVLVTNASGVSNNLKVVQIPWTGQNAFFKLQFP